MKYLNYLPLFILLSCLPKEEISFKPFSNSTVKIVVSDPFPDSLAVNVTAWTIIPRGTSRSDVLTLSKSGNYYLNLEVDRPAKGSLVVGESEFNLMIFPDDTVDIELSQGAENIEIQFSGSGGDINNYYYAKKKHFGYVNILSRFQAAVTSSSTYNSIKREVDDLARKELSFLDKYKKEHFLPEWFVDYETSEIIYATAGFKMTQPQRNARVHTFQDFLPDNYFSFLDSVEISNNRALYSSFYFLFLERYFVKDMHTDSFNQLPPEQQKQKEFIHLADLSKLYLSGRPKDIFDRRIFTSVIKSYSEPTKIDSIARALQIDDYEQLLPHLRPGDIVNGDLPLVNEYHSIVSIKDYHDKIIYINFWATWCGPCIANIPNLNRMIAKFADQPDVAFINICLDSQKDQWTESLSRHNIKGVNLFADERMSSKLHTFYYVGSIPHYVLVGKGNKLIENNTLKPQLIEAKIAEALLNAK